MDSRPNISIFDRDSSRFSLQLLVQALERNDQTNLTVLAKSVLTSVYDHLFFNYVGRTTENVFGVVNLRCPPARISSGLFLLLLHRGDLGFHLRFWRITPAIHGTGSLERSARFLQ